jgi:transposase
MIPKTIPQTAPVYVGLDVAKATLQVHLQGRQFPFSNDPAGHTRLCQQLKGVAAHVICEATGGYEAAVVRACHAAHIRVSVLNPAHVRHAAKAQGKRAKTDALDAALLTDYGQRFHPVATPPVSAVQHQLTELTLWLSQTVQAQALAKNQTEHQTNPFVNAQHQLRLDHYAAQIKAVEVEIKALLRQDPVLTQRVECLDRIVGVGPRTAWLVLAHLPELGQMNRQQTAALAGLAPWPEDSGAFTGQRHIRGGRHEVRRALYMPALSTIRSCPVLKPFYQRLVEQHKPAKVALTAVMRKLLVHMNSELKKLAAQPPPAVTGKPKKIKKTVAK